MGIIIKPLVTEKMTAITDKTNNRFGFIVRPEANKLEIKKEVEALYNVTVVDVNTMKYAGKNKSRYTTRRYHQRTYECVQESCCYVERRRYY